MTEPRVIKLGYYSPSQNGVIVSANGIAPCICGGGHGHDTDRHLLALHRQPDISGV